MFKRMTSVLKQPSVDSGSLRKRSWISLLMFVIGATSAIDYSLVGRVTVAETIAFLSVPLLWLSSGGFPMNAHFKKAIALLLLMFVGIVLGDLINQAPLLFSARAFARPVFMLGFLLFFIPVLMRDPLSLIYMIYGRVLSGIVNYYRPSKFEKEGAADVAAYAGVVFRIEPLIAAFAIAFAVFIYPRSRLLAALSFLMAAATVAAVGGTRSGLLIWVTASAVTVGILLLKSKHSRHIELSTSRLCGLGALLGMSLTAVYFFYIWAAPQGILGEDQQNKIVNQQNTVFGVTPHGFILAGRPQVYGAILGIMDRPLFGFGSWRQDLTSGYVVEAIATVGTDSTIMNQLNRGGMVGGAGHSVLFQSWLENGLLPAIAYLLIFIIMLRVALFNIRYDNRITPYIIITFVGFTWDFLFSPPSLALRFTVGLFLAFYVVFMDKQRPLSRVSLLP